MGRGTIRVLSSMDNLVLLHPNPENPKVHVEAPSEPGVVPRATNYQFMFIDLRPPQAMAPPPRPRPVHHAMLRGTSFAEDADGSGRMEDYLELAELGRGAFAVVKKVRHRETGLEYAMKVMDKRKVMRGAMGGQAGKLAEAAHEALKNKVLSEARLLKSIDHPGVIRFHKIFETEVHLCLVMELVEGGELFDHLLEHGPFAEADARCIMRQLLTALKYLHGRGIVHRDLKPENILLRRQDSVCALPQVKIADFGLAKLVGRDGANRAATFCGTPQYFAPEVLESRNSRAGYDSACDMWSVGVVMYVLLSGCTPFNDGDDEGEGQGDGAAGGAAAEPAAGEQAGSGGVGGGGPSSGAMMPPPPRRPPPLSIYEQIKLGVSRDTHFASSSWDSISPAAISLARKLLSVDPARRLDVHQALASAWMRGEDEDNEDDGLADRRASDAGTAQKLPRAPSSQQLSRVASRDEIEDSDEEESGLARFQSSQPLSQGIAPTGQGGHRGAMWNGPFAQSSAAASAKRQRTTARAQARGGGGGGGGVGSNRIAVTGATARRSGEALERVGCEGGAGAAPACGTQPPHPPRLSTRPLLLNPQVGGGKARATARPKENSGKAFGSLDIMGGGR